MSVLSKKLTPSNVAKKLGYGLDELRRASERIPGFPREVGGKLVVGDVALFLHTAGMRLPAEIEVEVERLVESKEVSDESDGKEIDELRSLNISILRKKDAKAGHDMVLAEVRARTAAGEVVLVDEVVEAIAPFFIQMSTELNSLGGKLAPRLAKVDDAHKIGRLIDEGVTNALRRIRDIDIKRIADEAARKTATVRSREKDRRATGDE